MALVMVISLAGCGNTASQSSGDTQSSAQETEASETQGKLVIGNLAYCNADEESVKTNEMIRMIAIIERKDSGYVSIKDSVPETYSLNDINIMEELQPVFDNMEVKLYDNLTSMTMALQSGDITCMSLYDSVAAYVCARNDDLEVLATYNYDYDSLDSEEGLPDEIVTSPSSDEFAFMMSERSEELCKEFDTAIAGMKEDGTLKELIREYITDQR